MNLISKTALAVAVTAAFAAGAQANTINGSLWEVSSTVAGEATLANVPTTTPTVTFTVDSTGLNFNSDGKDNYTVGSFLASGGASITSGASHANDSVNNTIWYFTGQVTMTKGQTYNTEHDDGLTLVIGGVTVVSKPDPTAAAYTPYTWTGDTGTYTFQLVYTENSGAPAVLLTTLPLTSQVADGGDTCLMLGGSLALIGFAARRVRK